MSNILTPTYLMAVEDRMQIVTENSYASLTSNLWYQKCTKFKTSESKREILIWLLNTAKVEESLDGSVDFDSLETHIHEYEHGFAGKGLKLNRTEFTDKDGKGLEFATAWSRDIGSWCAYWPQEKVGQMVRENTVLAYDGLTFFHAEHHLNPARGADGGTYANDFTGAASGGYPGALPIHEVGPGAVTLDVAIQNLGKALAYIRTIRTPNNAAPRNLRAKYLMHAPAMTNRVTQMLSAKTIVQAGTGGAGSADVEAIIKRFGMAEPVECPELAAEYGGSDTTWYLVVEDVVEGEVGALVYSEREPFQIMYHGLVDDAQLARMNELQWICRGRNVATTGHPYGMFRFRAS